jgi:hypothetical protein
MATAALSVMLRRPVKFIADRLESFLSDIHAREHKVKVRLACTKAGEILAFDLDDLTAMGPYSVYPRTSGIEGNQVVNLTGGHVAHGGSFGDVQRMGYFLVRRIDKHAQQQARAGCFVERVQRGDHAVVEGILISHERTATADGHVRTGWRRIRTRKCAPLNLHRLQRNSGMSLAAPRVVESDESNNLGHPRRKTGAGVELGQLAKGDHRCLLQHVIGRRSIHHDRRGDAPQPPP